MPSGGDEYNCGLDLIMLCEAFLRGFLPTYDNKMLASIHKNGHLISFLAAGIPLLGERSLYPIELYNEGLMDLPNQKTQKAICTAIPLQFLYDEAHYRYIKGTPYACCMTEPYPYESIYFKDELNIPGEKIYIGSDGNCLFYCYAFFMKQNFASTKYDTSSLNGFLQKLQKDLLKTINEDLTEAFLDCARNRVLENLEDDKQSLETLLNFECFYCQEYDEEKDTIYKIYADQAWENTVNVEVDNTKFDDDYDFFDGEKNFKESRMPDSPQLFHFSFCYLFNTTIVVYTQKPDMTTSTQIYCPDPADKRIFYSDKIVPQDFNEYPNQLLFYQPLNMRDYPLNSTLHFDVLLPDTFYMNMDLEENEKDSGDDDLEENEKDSGDDDLEGNEKDSGDDGDKKDTKKSVQKKPSSSKKKEVKLKISRSLQKTFEELYENETQLQKRKNTKLDFSGEYFKSILEVKSQEQLVHNQRKQLEQDLKTAGCASYRDLVEERTHNENAKRSTENQEKNFF